MILLFTHFYQQMKKLLTLSIILCCFPAVFGQVAIGSYGAQQIFGAVSSLGRDIVRAAEYKKEKEEREQQEAEYMSAVARADELFTQGQYQQALEQYNQALRFRQEQYVRDQIDRCNAELARAGREQYRLLIDKADEQYAQMNYAAAIENYTAALEVRNEQYPKDRIALIKADQERWKKVHFSGLMISDSRIDEFSSRAYANDPFSDFLGPGKYHFIDDFLIYSNFQTLDGIAVPANVRLVIYSEPYFKGKVLLDVVGPAIINNSIGKNDPAAAEAHTREFIAPLQDTFPQSVRTWSVGDMTGWINGSMEISTL